MASPVAATPDHHKKGNDGGADEVRGKAKIGKHRGHDFGRSLARGSSNAPLLAVLHCSNMNAKQLKY